MQYIGEILLLAIAVLLFFSIGRKLLKMMDIGLITALLSILFVMIADIIPPYETEKVVIMWGGIAFAIIAAWWWIWKGTIKTKIFTFLGVLVAAGLITLYRYFVPMDYAYSAGMIIYPFAVGIVAFILARKARSTMIISVLSIFISEFILSWIPSYNEKLIVGNNTEVMVIAVITGVLLSCILSMIMGRKNSKKSEYEIARSEESEI